MGYPGYHKSLSLNDALSSASWERKKKKRERNSLGAFIPGLDMTWWLCHVGFLWLLGAIKG
jgi:hypothetical protein